MDYKQLLLVVMGILVFGIPIVISSVRDFLRKRIKENDFYELTAKVQFKNKIFDFYNPQTDKFERAFFKTLTLEKGEIIYVEKKYIYDNKLYLDFYPNPEYYKIDIKDFFLVSGHVKARNLRKVGLDKKSQSEYFKVVNESNSCFELKEKVSRIHKEYDIFSIEGTKKVDEILKQYKWERYHLHDILGVGLLDLDEEEEDWFWEEE